MIITVVVTIIIFTASNSYAQFASFNRFNVYTTNSLVQKEPDISSSDEKKDDFSPRLALSVRTMYAFLDTELRFVTPKGLLSFQVNLENNLDLVE